LLFAKTYVT